jgi:hypothetical protein
MGPYKGPGVWQVDQRSYRHVGGHDVEGTEGNIREENGRHNM